MTKHPSLVDLINQNMNNIKKNGIGLLQIEETILSGTTVLIDGKLKQHFGSCSYLNLEIDSRLKAAAIAAIQQYGIQFSSSRAYISVPLYQELETLLSQIFGGPTLLTPTSTLGHIANIPLMVGKKDVVLLDHQVHNSVQNAVKIASASGTHVEMVRHNNLNFIENRIQKLKDKHEKIWYMADGIYSMYGDACPIKDLYQLLEKHEQFHLYVDDAHGMSWAGKHGAGYILDQVDLHPKMILVTSLCKGFGASGGATILPSQEFADNIRHCGSTHIFSSPLQPGILAAAIASAKIHLSDEITALQNQLNDNIRFFQQVANELQLPLVDLSFTPIQYIAAGQTEVAVKLCKQLLEKGYYTCVAGYPSVPANNCGLRITINRLHTKDQIRGLLTTLSDLMTNILVETNSTRESILKAFK